MPCVASNTRPMKAKREFDVTIISRINYAQRDDHYLTRNVLRARAHVGFGENEKLW